MATLNNNEMFNLLLTAKQANAKRKAQKQENVYFDEDRNVVLIQNNGLFVSESFERFKTRTYNFYARYYKVSKLKKDDVTSLADAFYGERLIYLDDYEEAYLNKELKKVRVSFTKKDYKEFKPILDITNRDVIRYIPLHYAHGKFYSTNAHTIMCTNVHIESDEENLQFFLYPFFLDCISTFAPNGFEGWFYINESNHVVVATNDDFCIISPNCRFKQPYGDWLENGERELIAEATLDEMWQNIAEDEDNQNNIVLYGYPILKEDFLRFSKKIGKEKITIEYAKNAVEVILFNKTIATQMKGKKQ